jgi:6-pyruvoyltetrahydropterin/6-carboxytetrahydropterin synthase
LYDVTIKKVFSAAHKLAEIGGACEKLHGHNFTVEVTLTSEGLNREGLVIDFRDLKGWLGEILDGLDHKCLNELPEFKELNPSAEHIARFIHDRLKAKIPQGVLSISNVTVWESENARVTYKE